MERKVISYQLFELSLYAHSFGLQFSWFLKNHVKRLQDLREFFFLEDVALDERIVVFG